MHFYYKYKLPAIVNESGDKRIFVFGDSFGQLARMPKHIRPISWMSQLALHLDAQVHSYGISGAAESTILYTYLEAHKEERDFTIIFHTHPKRPDQYYDLRDLTFQDYARWDKALKKHPCLHLYWTSLKPYEFTNGQTLSCNYWMKLYEIDSTGEGSWNSLQIARNHMDDEDNKHFAMDVYNKIKGEF